MIAPDGRQKFTKLAARFCLRVCHTRGAKTLASLPNCYVAVSKRNIDPQYAVIDPKRGDLGMGRLKAV